MVFLQTCISINVPAHKTKTKPLCQNLQRCILFTCERGYVQMVVEILLYSKILNYVGFQQYTEMYMLNNNTLGMINGHLFKHQIRIEYICLWEEAFSLRHAKNNDNCLTNWGCTVYSYIFLHHLSHVFSLCFAYHSRLPRAGGHL